ncbi:hypothetical protein NFJ02_42g109030 [Pycnococcus provasolii]
MSHEVVRVHTTARTQSPVHNDFDRLSVTTHHPLSSSLAIAAAISRSPRPGNTGARVHGRCLDGGGLFY